MTTEEKKGQKRGSSHYISQCYVLGNSVVADLSTWSQECQEPGAHNPIIYYSSSTAAMLLHIRSLVDYNYENG